MPDEQKSIALCIQVQTPLSPQLDINRLYQLFESISTNNGIVERYVTASSNNGDNYIDFIFKTKAAGELWRQIRDRIYNDAAIGAGVAQSSIVICEGKNGWNDYFLLHHFNPEEKLDTMR
jgi:hypothetical protein